MRSHRFPIGARVRVGDAHAKAANTLTLLRPQSKRWRFSSAPAKARCLMECGDAARSAESPLSTWSAGSGRRRSRESGECATLLRAQSKRWRFSSAAAKAHVLWSAVTKHASAESPLSIWSAGANWRRPHESGECASLLGAAVQGQFSGRSLTFLNQQGLP